MKTIEKEEKSMRGAHTVTTRHDSPPESPEIKPDYPLSEKDEVKLAERKMLKSRNKLL
jgi:hypothetical protein